MGIEPLSRVPQSQFAGDLPPHFPPWTLAQFRGSARDDFSRAFGVLCKINVRASLLFSRSARNSSPLSFACECDGAFGTFELMNTTRSRPPFMVNVAAEAQFLAC